MPEDWPTAIVLGIVVGGMLTALVVCAAMKKALSRKKESE